MKSFARIAGGITAAGIAGALALTPVAGLSGVAVSRAQETMESNLSDLTDGTAPGVTTVTDANDQPIAYIYDQYRQEVTGDKISPAMKQAVVSIEDRRFYEHEGVDWQGTARAMAKNVFSGSVQEGASTLNQQYVKNYLLLVDAKDEAEQAAATETSYARKLREMRMASDLDKRLSKDDILTRYLNIVPFGNGAFGIEAASQTYFGIPAAELTVPQSAMLAGMLQSSSSLNPYTNETAVIDRRNLVLDTMVESQAISPAEAAELKQQPLAVLPAPKRLANGCIGAGDSGFFCDYVLEYLKKKEFPVDELGSGNFRIKTTLDPTVQANARAAVTRQADPASAGVAEVMNVVEPGKDSRRILAMVSSRNYGLNLDAGETVFPQASTRLGNGAGSVFKIFTAATALEKGMGVNTMLDVPKRVELQGLGDGGAKNCPAGFYCVENSGVYKPQMTLKDALAQSPNTTFVNLIKDVGVGDTVDMAVRLGLRDYKDAGSFDGQASIADYVRDHNLGSFTLGPTAVNPLELSNVGATIASEGVWCEPNPIDKITDRDGNEIPIKTPDCEKAVEPDIAHAISDALTADATTGTAADAAKAYGWNSRVAAKTGTTESHLSSAFLGFNSGFAAAPYIFNDGLATTPLCSAPLRQCGDGTLYGGMEAARTWFDMASRTPAATSGDVPKASEQLTVGAAASASSEVQGLTPDAAAKKLEARGIKTETKKVPGPSNLKGQVMSLQGIPSRGNTVTLLVSDGTQASTVVRTQAPTPVSPVPGAPSIPAIPVPPGQPVAPPAPNLNDLSNAVQDALRQNGIRI